MKRTAYLDLDGVLVDFVRGAFNWHRNHLVYQTAPWNLWDAMGLSAEEFWTPLGYGFWSTLTWMPDGPRILEDVERIFGDRVLLVSSPRLTDGCMDGKRDWVKNNLPTKWRRRLCLVNDKQLLAHPNAVLIDDSDHNLEVFEKAGGKVQRVARPWNQWQPFVYPDGTMQADLYDKMIANLLRFKVEENG